MAQEVKNKREMESEELSIERRKIELEEAKLKLERDKAKWTALSVFIPLLVVICTIFAGFQNQAQQAKSSFELKAAEIVMNDNSPTGTYNKARALAALFPNRLPDNFAENFDPKEYTVISTVNSKKELLKLIAEHPEQKQELIDMWKRLFPADEWLNDLTE